MLTPKYAAMSIQEQREFVGALVHLCQTQERCYDAALQILAWAQKNGYLERVKILPPDWSDVPNDMQDAP